MPGDIHTPSELHGIVKFLLGPAMVYLSELSDDLESQGNTVLAEKVRAHATAITRIFSAVDALVEAERIVAYLPKRAPF